MNAPNPDPTPAKPPKPDFAFQIHNAISALAAADKRGDLAELRRMDADAPDAPAFFRILAKVAPEASPETMRKLALVAQILALEPQLPSAGEDTRPIGLGLAMERADISESRVQRLLSARDAALRDQVRLIGRRLANAGFMPWRDLANLILDHDDRLDDLRLRIARDYWLELDRKNAQDKN
jgi:CRISPR system Cascade subunit CasB